MIVGIDEAGRGCWAGPLVAAAVALREPIAGLKDSKAISKARRQFLAEEIKQKAHVGVGLVDARQIDSIGLTEATKLAMGIALGQLKISYDRVVIDGNYNYLPDIKNVETMIKADVSIQEVSAASIIAKVTRDNYMNEAAKQFPNYKFESHVGYGTALHLSLLKAHGVCELHRLSYKPVKIFL